MLIRKRQRINIRTNRKYDIYHNLTNTKTNLIKDHAIFIWKMNGYGWIDGWMDDYEYILALLTDSWTDELFYGTFFDLI
uniref:Uncharacterized protein n=1 Tax=Onchocerca volvulus TaxID=6282 RepID=A0A8R1XQU5_ONCVO